MNFKKTINVDYPAHNRPIFEEWFSENYAGCKTDRELLPIWFTSFYVNNNYGNDMAARKELQDYLNSLDRGKKYFSIIQYDDAILDNISHLDLLQFNMSKTYDIPIPLICQPHPYTFPKEKKYTVSFVGSRTHPARNGIEKYINKEGWYISYEQHSIERYCEVMAQSVFTIAPRGYGLASFRCYECLQFNSIPIYLSDFHVIPFNLNFDDFGVLYDAADISSLASYISMIPEQEILRKQNNIPVFYDKYFSYLGCMNNIINELEKEKRQRN